MLEPGILLHPDLISGRGVHEWEVLGQVAPIVAHDIRELILASHSQVVAVGVVAHQDSELDLGHELQQTWVPLLGKALARGQVTRPALAGKVEVHGHDGKLARVIEGVAVHAEPIAQAIPTLVVPDDMRVLGDASRRLSHDHDACVRAGKVEGVYTRRSVLGVLFISPDLFKHLVKPAGSHCHSPHLPTCLTVRSQALDALRCNRNPLIAIFCDASAIIAVQRTAGATICTARPS